MKAFERSRNSENKTTEKRAVSYLFVHRRFKVRLFTSQVLLIFYLLLRRKIVFKDDYIIMQIRFCNDEWTVLREGPRWKMTLRFWVVFGWQVSSQDLKTEPYSIPSDKKLKPAQHISNCLFPVEVSQTKGMERKGKEKQTFNYSIFLNPDLSLNAISLSFFFFLSNHLLDKGIRKEEMEEQVQSLLPNDWPQWALD